MAKTLTCELCSAALHLKFNISEYIKHLIIFHAHQPTFKDTCRIGGCQRKYTNLGTFRNHIYGMHSDYVMQGGPTQSFMVDKPNSMIGDEVDDVNDSDDDDEDGVRTCYEGSIEANSSDQLQCSS